MTDSSGDNGGRRLPDLKPVPEMGRALAILRFARGFNQHQLALAAGLHSPAISDYERGRSIPETATIDRLLQALGYSWDALALTRDFLRRLDSRPPAPAPDAATNPEAHALASDGARLAYSLILALLEGRIEAEVHRLSKPPQQRPH